MCIRLNISFTNALAIRKNYHNANILAHKTHKESLYINSISLNYTLYYISHDNLLRYFTPFI